MQGRAMSSINSIPSEKLARLVGTHNCPALVDVRTKDDFEADPRLVPGSVQRSHDSVDQWAAAYRGRSAVVICSRGLHVGQGVAALLREAGTAAEVLEDGFEGWARSGLPLVPASKLPPRDSHGRTLWVTRERPKIDRIACPWLIRRFVDPAALFLFVAPSEVVAVAEKFDATSFDIEGVFWSHRGEVCTFDVMIEEFGLGSPALLRLATIVRGADTARFDLAPEVPGLLAASLGLSRMYPDDLTQLEAGMTLYDAFYRWCRDATHETHNWPTAKKGA
jgi:rhodanese-related sulfurtransferase